MRRYRFRVPCGTGVWLTEDGGDSLTKAARKLSHRLDLGHGSVFTADSLRDGLIAFVVGPRPRMIQRLGRVQ